MTAAPLATLALARCTRGAHASARHLIISMRAISCIIALSIIACSPSHDGRRASVDSSARGGQRLPVAGAAQDSLPSRQQGAERGALAASDPWLASADSAMRRLLDGERFLSTRAPGFSGCDEDEGSDNPPIGAAVASARPIRRTSAELDESFPGRPRRRAEYDVEVATVAIEVPQWIARFPSDSAMRNIDPYEMRLGARTDTFSVSIAQAVDSAGHGGWEACEPTGPAVSVGDGPGFWHFIHANDSLSTDMRVVRWLPVGGSWTRIAALADSARRAATAR